MVPTLIIYIRKYGNAMRCKLRLPFKCVACLNIYGDMVYIKLYEHKR